MYMCLFAAVSGFFFRAVFALASGGLWDSYQGCPDVSARQIRRLVGQGLLGPVLAVETRQGCARAVSRPAAPPDALDRRVEGLSSA